MKRCWFGAGALAALLVLGLLSSRWLDGQAGNLTNRAGQVRDQAQAQDWAGCRRTLEDLTRQWQRRQLLHSLLTDQNTVGTIRELLRQLEQAVAAQDPESVGAAVHQLEKALRDLADSHRPTVENILQSPWKPAFPAKNAFPRWGKGVLRYRGLIRRTAGKTS